MSIFFFSFSFFFLILLLLLQEEDEINEKKTRDIFHAFRGRISQYDQIDIQAAL